MSTTIKLRRSAVPGNVPTTAQLDLGELAINTADGKIYFKKYDPDANTESIVDVSANLDPNAILELLKTVDGANSGLDADLLDGQSGDYYLDYNNFTNVPPATLDLTLSGKVTGNAFSNTGIMTLTTELANTGVIAGVYGSSTAIPVFTVDEDGRITVANTSPVSGVENFSYAAANNTITLETGDGSIFNIQTETEVTLTGKVTGTATATDGNLSIVTELANTGVVAGSYGSSTAIPVLAIDEDGRITLASTASVAGVDNFFWTAANNTLILQTGDGAEYIVPIEVFTDITVNDLTANNIIVSGTVDGRDVATDGTKLDGIEASADVTDTANVTAAGALMDSELTSIASVKALNQGVATTDSPTFAEVIVRDAAGDFSTNTADARLTLKAGNLTAGELGFVNTTSGQFSVRNKLDGDMRFRLENTTKRFRFEDTTGSNTIATISNSGLKIGGGNTSASEALEVVGNIVATGLTVTDAYAWLNIDGSSTAQYSGGNLWLSNSATANNYGVALSSQIANADTTGSTFALNEVSSTGTYSKTIFSYDHNNSTFSHNQYNYFNSGLGVAGDISVTGTVDGRDVAADGTKLDGIEAGATADQTAADIRGLGFFDTTNDGGGSGLDADLLDGQHASEIIAAAVSQAGAQIGNGLVDINSGVGLTGSGSFNLNDFSNTSITISHADTSSVANTSNTNGNVVSGITFDTFGHTQAVTSTNLDNRYYTETELNAGQLNNLYYTETELNNGQLDTRYYTETEADNRFVNVTGDTMSGSLTVNADIIQSESKFVSITQTTASTSEVAILTFAHASFAAAEVLITATDATNRHMTKLLITHNGSTAIATEYGVVYTSTELATFDVLISASNLQLRATPASSSSTVFKIVATLIDA